MPGASDDNAGLEGARDPIVVLGAKDPSMTLTPYPASGCRRCDFRECALQGRGLIHTKGDVSESSDHSALKRLEELGFVGRPCDVRPSPGRVSLRGAMLHGCRRSNRCRPPGRR